MLRKHTRKFGVTITFSSYFEIYTDVALFSELQLQMNNSKMRSLLCPIFCVHNHMTKINVPLVPIITLGKNDFVTVEKCFCFSKRRFLILPKQNSLC